MKRLVLLLLTLAILCGCARQASKQNRLTATTAPTDTQPAETTQPTQAVPQEPLQTYPLELQDCIGIAPMGEEILLFAQGETTKLKTLSGAYEAMLADCVTPTDGFVQISADGICYFSKSSHALIRCSAELQEIARIEVPAEITAPLLDAACTTLYYTSGSAVYAYSLTEGIARLIGQFRCEAVVMEKLLCDDTVLQCFLSGGEMGQSTLFISTETGEILAQNENVYSVQTAGETYFAQVQDGSLTLYVTGTADCEARELLAEYSRMTLLPDMGCVLSAAADDAGITLETYDLETGKRTAELHLDGSGPAEYFCADDSGNIWFMLQEEQTLCRWDPSKSLTQDETVYTGPLYTAAEPDEAGLARCREKAQQLEEKYGVAIYLGIEASIPAPEDYSFTAEYQVPTLEKMLAELETALSAFPEGFFTQAVQYSASGKLQIALVRTLEGVGEDTLPTATGIQYWRDADACIALADDLQLTQNFYHELFHLIDNRVLGTSTVFDDWDSLNPDGFTYDNSFVENLNRNSYTNLDGDHRAFIDTYSMSYPGEDRARIFEYAMVPEGEAYFEARILQRKLACIWLGIREAFALEEYSGALAWEQYLKTSE